METEPELETKPELETESLEAESDVDVTSIFSTKWWFPDVEGVILAILRTRLGLSEAEV